MLHRNLKWAICLFISVAFLAVLFSVAQELPPVDITTSGGSTHTISTLDDAERKWNIYEGKLLTANQEMQKLKYERDIIDAAIRKDRQELKKFKTVTILVAGRQIGFAAAVNAIVDLLDNGNTYEMGLQRISKYASIRSQNSAIANAFSDRELFYAEYARRWRHVNSESNPVPPRTNKGTLESMQVGIPMLGADCNNACGTFYYDSLHIEYYSGFSGGIPTSLGSIPTYAKSYHHTSCTGTASCSDGYWTCDGIESGGTARHLLRTCKIQGRQWNSGTSSYDTVTCNMEYRNCDNPGGRCFNGSSAGNQPHNDNPPYPPSSGGTPPSAGNPPSGGGSNPPSGGGSNPAPTPSYHACGDHETSVSGDHSLQASCSSTDSNGNSCTVTNFYACGSHTHSYPAPPPTPTPTPPPEPTPTPPSPTTVACGAAGWTGCTASVSSSTEHRVPSCSGCGSTYWTCSTFASNHTTLKTCRYSECGQTWQKCASAPVCNKPYRKQNGLKCWAQ